MQYLNRIPHFDDLNDSIQNKIKNNIDKCIFINKIDGSPSIVFGRFNKKIFVSTKSIFNKKQIKINYTKEDIDNNHSNLSLKFKLYLLLNHLKDIEIEGIWQADYLYDYISLNSKVDNVLSFTPNTITYEIEKTSDIYKNVRLSSLGIYIHSKLEAISDYPREWKFLYLLSLEDKKYLSTNFHNTKLFTLLPYEQKISKVEDTEIKNEILKKLNKNPFLNSYINNSFIREGEGYCCIYEDILCKFVDKSVFTVHNNIRWGRT